MSWPQISKEKNQNETLGFVLKRKDRGAYMTFPAKAGNETEQAYAGGGQVSTPCRGVVMMLK